MQPGPIRWSVAATAAVMLSLLVAGREARAKCAIEWARHFASDYRVGVGVRAMPDGGYAVAGNMIRDVQLFGGDAKPLRLRARGTEDTFVVRLSAQGNVLWTRTIGGAGSHVSAGLAVRPDGTILVYGSYQGTPSLYGADDRPAASLPPSGKTALGGNERDAAFVASYSADGAPRLIATGAGTGNQSVTDLAPMGDDLVAFGYFEGKLQLGKSGSTIESRGERDAWLARLHPDGTAVWMSSMGGPGNEWSQWLAITPAGAIFVSGMFEDSGGTGAKSLTPPGALFGRARPVRLHPVGKADMFLARYDKDGEVVWASRLGGEEDFDRDTRDWPEGLAVTADGAILFAGRMAVPGELGAGNPRLTLAGAGDSSFIARFDAGGRLAWVVPGGDAKIVRPQILPGGDFVVSGSIGTRVRYPAVGRAQVTLTPSGRDDVLIARHDASGRLRWATRMGGTGHASGAAVAVDRTGALALSVYFNGNLSLEDDGGCAPIRVRGVESSYTSALVRVAPDAALSTQQREQRLAAVNNKAAALRSAARAAYRAKKYAAAAEGYRRLTDVAPDDAAAWTDLGVALMHAGRRPEAVEANQRALAVASRDREVDDSSAEANRRHAIFNLYKLGERLKLPKDDECHALPAPHGCSRTMWVCVKSSESQGTGGGSTWTTARLGASKEAAEFEAGEEIPFPDMTPPEAPTVPGLYISRPGTWLSRGESVDVPLGNSSETRCSICGDQSCAGCVEGEEEVNACAVVAADACTGVVGVACEVRDGKKLDRPEIRELCLEPAGKRR